MTSINVYTQTKKRVALALLRATSAYNSPLINTKMIALPRVSLDILKLLYLCCYFYSTFNVCVSHPGCVVPRWTWVCRFTRITFQLYLGPRWAWTAVR